MASNLGLFCSSLVVILIICKTSEALVRGRVKHSSVPPPPPGPLQESKDYVESGCVARKGVQDLNTTFINSVPAWFVPMASKFFYYKWAEALINRSIGQSEMPQLCLKWLFMAPTKPKGDYNIIVGGYKCAVTQLCHDSGFLTETCEAPKGSPEYHKGADNVATLVATDNQRWLLLARCTQKQYRDWAVLVNDPKTMDSALIKTIATEVKKQGFDLKNAENLKYDQCDTKNENEGEA